MRNFLRPFLQYCLVFGLLTTQACDTGTDVEYQVSEQGVFEIAVNESVHLGLQKVEFLEQKVQVPLIFGFFTHESEVSASTSAQPASFEDGILQLDNAIAVKTEELADGIQRFSVQAPAGSNAIRLTFDCPEDARYWGFGEQYNYVDLRGEWVPGWLQEQGVGRNKEANPGLGRGSFTHSYFPMPYFVDPKKGFGFLLENMEYSEFDMCRDNEQAWTVTLWNDSLSFLYLPGPSAMDVVGQLTQIVGRPASVPPEWSFEGAWISAQGGTEKVRTRINDALDAGIPVSAVWSQDWVGQRDLGGGNFGVKYRWAHDTDHYPDLLTLTTELAEKGVRFLGYFNPFILPEFQHFDEMDEAGYLIQNPDGTTWVENIITFDGSQVDVTNDKAKAYFQDYAQKAIDLGIVGWMSDFGEWLPYEAKVAKGSGAQWHNAYPTLWHQWSRETLEKNLGEDFILLTRSGYTGEQKVAQVVWAGDQEVEWEDTDGIPTVVRAGLTLGMAGIPYFAHDVGGFSGKERSEELQQRWTELGAFSPIMRTHEGLDRFNNIQFDTTETALAHFKKMSLAHKAFAPYVLDLAQEAKETGLPIIRHTAFVDPESEANYDAHLQWMIGNDVLFAPVVEEGATSVEVTFPKGNWQHFTSGTIYTGPSVATIDAPIGSPAIFYRGGAPDELLDVVRAVQKELQ